MAFNPVNNFTPAIIKDIQMSETFSDTAVKQALDEVHIELGDDFVVHILQTELLSACIMQNLKFAISNCAMHQRKFLNEKDITIAAQMDRCLIPRSHTSSRDLGYLLDPENFKFLCEKHIAIAMSLLRRFDDSITDIKISREVALVFQELVEQHLRGFLEHVAKNLSSHKTFGYKQCATFLTQMIGHVYDDE